MKRIALIGYRGSGKSTVGPLVAAALGWQFVDADLVLEADTGRSIAAIFAEGGEPLFRIHEASTLECLLTDDRIVIATGGGIVLSEINRRLLAESAFTVWLEASAETCWERIEFDVGNRERRPNLTTGGFEEVTKSLTERRPFYESTAHVRVDSGASPQAIADRIVQAWHTRQATQ